MPLKDVLGNMLASPAFADGQVVPRKLAKGLTIKLKRKGDGIMIQLSRDDAAPSMAEWKAVIACWPGQVTVIEEPLPLKPQGTRRFLRGKVRENPRLVDVD